MHPFRLTIACIWLSCLMLVSTSSRAQVYVDLLAGLHPQLLNDGGASIHLNAAIGNQTTTWLGYGVHIGTMGIVNISTNLSFITLGLQYRLLDKQHRFYGKLEAGSLLSSSYTTDSPLQYDYQKDFNPYTRLYCGYRFGRFTMGVNYTYISQFQENISEYDSVSGEYLPTDRSRTRDQQDLQIFIGLSLDSYRVKRRKD